jgi:hypothetical protein
MGFSFKRVSSRACPARSRVAALAAAVTFLCVWRAITAELAAKIGIRQEGLDSTMERLAAALEVPVAWIA